MIFISWMLLISNHDTIRNEKQKKNTRKILLVVEEVYLWKYTK